MYRNGKLIAQLFVDVGVTLVCMVDGYEKGLRFPEDLCIHDGGDEGNRTPDLLTASQALSQLSYAPVTNGYYRGMFAGMQGRILNWLSSLRVFLGRGKNNHSSSDYFYPPSR